MLMKAYGLHALRHIHCNVWFNKMKDGAFDAGNSERQPPKMFQLQRLLDKDDDQTQKMITEQLNVS